MRKTFLEPELEVVRFGTEDIITTSLAVLKEILEAARILMSGGQKLHN